MDNVTTRLMCAILIAGAVMFAGCEGGDDGDDGTAAGGTVANIAGSWRFTATHDGGTESSVNTIQQNGASVTMQTAFGMYSGTVSGSNVTMTGPGQEVDAMELNMTLNNVGNPTSMSGTWTDIENGQRTGSGPISAVKL